MSIQKEENDSMYESLIIFPFQLLMVKGAAKRYPEEKSPLFFIFYFRCGALRLYGCTYVPFLR